MLTRIEVIKHHRDGVPHTEIYERSEIYCPNCGKQTVWLDTNDDFYVGKTGLCLSCKHSHNCAGDFMSPDSDSIFNIEFIQHKLSENEDA